MDVFLIVYLVGVLGVLVLTLRMSLKELPKKKTQVPEPGKPSSMISVDEATQMYDSISTSLVQNIRSALGLDIGGGVVEAEQEQEPDPFIHDLELDPFMRELDGWPVEQEQSDQPQLDRNNDNLT